MAVTRLPVRTPRCACGVWPPAPGGVGVLGGHSGTVSALAALAAGLLAGSYALGVGRASGGGAGADIGRAPLADHRLASGSITGVVNLWAGPTAPPV